MSENIHLSSQFDEDLGRLRSNVLQMGGLVENQVMAAIEAYKSGEVARVKSIIETEHTVNELEKAIDDDCTHLIARRQPTASDLRLVFGILKIVTDLERIGDEAKKIAKGVRRICEAGQVPSDYSAGVRHIAEAALGMVRESLDAFARLDSGVAEAVIRADTDVDTEFKSIVRQLITHMMEDPRIITTSIDILSIARAVERIGDHAKNIAEHVVFIVDGRDIRHQGKGKKAIEESRA
jgi:phosphate transport system protein